MNLILARDPSKNGRTFGSLYDNNVWQCYTLEDEVRPLGEKVPGKTAIPPGKYDVVIDASSRFRRDMPHILDVPNFTGIRIHIGNTEADTEGCILVGRTRGTSSIGESALAFDALFQKLKAALSRGEQITIEVRNAA